MVSELCFGKATHRSHRTRRKAWASTKTRPRSQGFKWEKRGGTAAPNGPKRELRLWAENGASESGKKKPLPEIWQGLTGPEDRLGKGPRRGPKANPYKQGTRAPFRGRRCVKRSASEATAPKHARPALAQRLGQGFGTCLMSGNGKLWQMLGNGASFSGADPRLAPTPAWHGVGGYLYNIYFISFH